MAGEAPRRRGLIVDWGGVMTTSVFAAFDAFCRAEGLPAGRVASVFRDDPEGRALLVDLECGRLDEAVFERRLAGLLGVASDGLIGRLFQAARGIAVDGVVGSGTWGAVVATLDWARVSAPAEVDQLKAAVAAAEAARAEAEGRARRAEERLRQIAALAGEPV